MVRCSSCGHLGDYYSPTCPICKKKYTVTPKELDDKLTEIDDAMAKKDYALALEGYRFLADIGHLPSMREYASILESGTLIKKDLDGAMRYFGIAAERGDAYSAYRYSRLAERTSETASVFWLTFAAVKGCLSAYPAMAELLSSRGKDSLANYYYRVSADGGHTGSIITMAERYIEGIGCEKSAEHAKWFIDKFTIPPIQALKLAYKLRSVKAVEPPEPEIKGYADLLRSLAKRAEALNYRTAAFSLTQMISDKGDYNATCRLGQMYLEGYGTRKDEKQAMDLLSLAAAHGCADAALTMGDAYVKGVDVEANAELALKYYSMVNGDGRAKAYERMGDIYLEGRLVRRDYPEALRLYTLAAESGNPEGQKKAQELKRRREEIFERGMSLRTTDKAEAFKCFAISTGMGYLPAYTALGACYLHGLGTTKDRPEAYRWFKEAADKGDTAGIYLTATCLQDGVGINRNLKLARDYLTRASALGVEEAEKRLLALLDARRKKLVKRAFSYAMENIYNKRFEAGIRALEVPVKFGLPKAIYTMGCLAEFGMGIPTDRALAYASYERAFEKGFRDPSSSYKLMILRMAKPARGTRV